MSEYLKGYRAGLTASPEAVARADARRAPSAWYVGFFDAEAGREKAQ